jgi:hypothetical protein
MALEGGVMKKPVWIELFDPCERDHFCYLLTEDLKAMELGARETLSHGIQKYLITPLIAYINDHHRDGCIVDCVEEACKLLDFVETDLLYDLEHQIVDFSRVQELEMLWTRFVAAGAAYRIYHDLPLEMDRPRILAEKANERYKSAKDDALAIALAFLRDDDKQKYRIRRLALEVWTTMEREKGRYKAFPVLDTVVDWLTDARKAGKLPDYLAKGGAPKKK